MIYEFHVTLQNANKEKFKSFCSVLKVKPIILDIQQKDSKSIYEEVMTSSTENFKTDLEAKKHLDYLVKKLKEQSFEVIREKIECEPTHKDINKCLQNKYLEAHLNVFVKNDQTLENVTSICKNYNVHLSRNVNKQLENGFTIMITYRENVKLKIFKHKLNKIIKEIKQFHNIEKEVIEYALFDSNLNYDTQWLKD